MGWLMENESSSRIWAIRDKCWRQDTSGWGGGQYTRMFVDQSMDQSMDPSMDLSMDPSMDLNMDLSMDQSMDPSMDLDARVRTDLIQWTDVLPCDVRRRREALPPDRGLDLGDGCFKVRHGDGQAHELLYPEGTGAEPGEERRGRGGPEDDQRRGLSSYS